MPPIFSPLVDLNPLGKLMPSDSITSVGTGPYPLRSSYAKHLRPDNPDPLLKPIQKPWYKPIGLAPLLPPFDLVADVLFSNKLYPIPGNSMPVLPDYLVAH